MKIQVAVLEELEIKAPPVADVGANDPNLLSFYEVAAVQLHLSVGAILLDHASIGLEFN